MLPQNMLEPHQRYKRDTAAFVTFLTTEAMKCSYVLPEVVPASAAIGATSQHASSKGKTKKVDFKEASQRVPVIELRKQAVAVLNATVEIPRWAGEALWRAIRARRRFTDWFSTLTENNPAYDSNSDTTHSHFTDQLEEIASMLSIPSRYPRFDPADNTKVTTTGPKMPLLNLFEVLSIERADNEDGVTSMPKHTLQGTSYTSEPEDASKEEELFRLFSLFEEMHNIQAYLVPVFKQCAEGRLSFEEASLVVGAAIETVKQTEQALYDPMGKIYPSYDDVIAVLQRADSELFNAGEVIHRTEPRPTSFLYTTTATSLKRFREVFLHYTYYPARIPVLTEELKTLYAAFEGWPDEDASLAQYMIDLVIECRYRAPGDMLGIENEKIEVNAYSLDGISKALTWIIYDNKPIPCWVVFAAELFHDLKASVGENFEAADSRLSAVAQRIKTQVQHISKTAEKLSPEDLEMAHKLQSSCEWGFNWSVPSTRYMNIRLFPPMHELTGYHRVLYEHMNSRDQTMAKLNVRIFQREMNLSEVTDFSGNPALHASYLRRCIGPSLDPRYLRRANPLLCGPLLLQLNLIYDEFGMRFANSHPSICAVGQLYHAEQQAGKMNAPWPKMNVALTKHLKEIFRGTLPTEYDAILQRALLAAGTNPAFLAEAKRLAKFQSSGRSSKSINIGKLKSQPPWELRPSSLIAVLRDIFNGKDTFGQALYRLDRLMQQQALTAGNGPSKPLVRSINGVRFLEELSTYLVVLRDQFQIDYVTLTRTCNALCRQMDERMNAEVYKEDHRRKIDWQIPSMNAFAILMNVVEELHDADKAASKLMKDDPARFHGTQLADIAAQVLLGYIEGDHQAEGVPGEKEGLALIGFDRGVMLVRTWKGLGTKADTGTRVAPE